MMKLTKFDIAAVLIITLGVVIRFLYMYLPESRMSMDESTYGMQAFHILNGERSVFFYNQPYTGTLSAYLTAIFFAIFGVNDLWVKFVPFLFSIGFLITSYMLAIRVLRNQLGSLLAVTLLSLAAPFWLNWTSRAGTGYPEMMFFGNIVFLLTLGVVYDNLSRKKEAIYFFFWGLCIGIGYWIQPTIIYYATSSLVFIFFYRPLFFLRPEFYTSVLGFVIGALPPILWNLEHQNLTNRSLFHKPFGVFKSIQDFFLLGLPVIMGTRKPFSSTDLFSPLAWVVYGVYFAAFGWTMLTRIKHHLENFFGKLSPIDLMLLHCVFILVIFSLSAPFNQFVIEPRYISALYTPLPIILAYFCARVLDFNKILGGLVVVVLIVNSLFAIYKIPPTAFVDQYKLDEVLQYLKEKNIKYAWGEFEYSYRLVLETQESIISSPIDNLFGANRYPEYIKSITNAPKDQVACVIYREHNDCTFALGEGEKEMKQIGRFRVYTLK